MPPKELEAKELYDGPFLTILWDTPRRIIGIRWKPSTAKMTDEDFKAALMLFASHVEQMGAHGILVDVEDFHHRMGPDVQEWRIKNISNRYAGAGVGRFAFLFPPGSQIPPMMNQSAEGESFATRAFTSQEHAVDWLTEM
jgi:hypothetical protein